MNEHVLSVLSVGNGWMTGEELQSWYSRQLPERFIERKQTVIPGDKAVLVVGPRQAGKSTLLWKSLAETGRSTLMINCEEPSLREWLTSPALVAADLKASFPDRPYILLEEVQHLAEAGLFLKGLVDLKTGFQILATGSSAFDLESRTRESLAGRARRHLLLPFSLDELSGAEEVHPALKDKQRTAMLKRLAVLGGYPAVASSATPEIELSHLLESFIIRDASDRFRIRHIDAFRRLMELMARQIGNLCNYSEWSSILGISNDTVSNYIDLLEDSHIVRRVRPYAGGRRAEITGTPKIYFLDNGIRNRLTGNFAAFGQRDDSGALLENLVFSELAKLTHPLLDSIDFWRSKAGGEVDFVVHTKGRVLPVEVKISARPGRLTRSQHSFIQAYQPEEFWILHTGQEDEEKKIATTRVRWLPIHRLSREISSFNR